MLRSLCGKPVPQAEESGQNGGSRESATAPTISDVDRRERALRCTGFLCSQRGAVLPDPYSLSCLSSSRFGPLSEERGFPRNAPGRGRLVAPPLHAMPC